MEHRIDIRRGLYFGLVVNLAAVAVLNNPYQASSRAWLVTLGAVNELLGVLLIASPEIERVTPSVVAAVRRRKAFVVHAVRRLLGRTRGLTISVPPGIMHMRGMGGAVVTTGPSAVRTLEQRVEELEVRVREGEARLSQVEGDVARLPDRWREELAGVRTELEQVQQDLVRRTAEARIHLRLLGLGYVLVGIVLSWLGNVL